MTSGRRTLHDIDRAIGKARKSIEDASVLPSRIAESLADIRRKQTAAFDQIARDRLELIESGNGGDLGYVDRQAEKLLKAHAGSEAKMIKRVQKVVSAIEKLEERRREQETKVEKAVNAYDKKAADVEMMMLNDPGYQSQLDRVESAEATVSRAEEKLSLAREDEKTKGEPYRRDPFFSYLQRRQYGTKQAKGWFLTKALDHWIAGLCNYRDAAENYRRLTAIPQRLEGHVKALEETVSIAQNDLHSLESDILKREGVTTLRSKSLNAQKALDKIDADIQVKEDEHQALRNEQAALNSGRTGPYKEAVDLLSQTLSKQNVKRLRYFASQTRTRDDDRALIDLRELAEAAEELDDDREEAQSLLKKYQRTLKDLEKVRRQYKKRRYDAPSSVISGGDLISALLGQVLAGVLSGDDFWRQIVRAQRTVRRYSDNDFGGIDWTEGLRLPRQSGGWGGGSRRRTSIPRSPRRSLPRMPSGGGGGGGSRSSGGGSRGGFRTGGGF